MGDAWRRLPYCKSLYINKFPWENKEITSPTPPKNKKSTDRSYVTAVGPAWGWEKASKVSLNHQILGQDLLTATTRSTGLGVLRVGLGVWFFLIPQ